MLCENCKNAEATCHYRQTINGKTTEAHLCAECAEKLGYETAFSMYEPGFEVDNFLGQMFGRPRLAAAQRTCPLCGAAESDIARTGKVGCAQCYTAFAGLLDPYIRRLHGNSAHAGRVPLRAGKGLNRKRRLEQLKGELQRAVDSEEFEKAIELRDQIKELEQDE